MSTLKYVLRKFGIRIGRSERMPREIRDTDRVTLAELFAELGFKNGVEIGVNEGDYSETLCKVNSGLHLACI